MTDLKKLLKVKNDTEQAYLIASGVADKSNRDKVNALKVWIRASDAYWKAFDEERNEDSNNLL